MIKLKKINYKKNIRKIIDQHGLTFQIFDLDPKVKTIILKVNLKKIKFSINKILINKMLRDEIKNKFLAKNI